MNLLFTYPETIVDGEGIRYSIYLAGCHHHCAGCQNPESWSPQAGTPLTQEKIEAIFPCNHYQKLIQQQELRQQLPQLEQQQLLLQLS